MSEAALRVCDLRVRRSSRAGDFELRIDELSLSRGEVLTVLGPNGSGKTTLLRALAGLEGQARGSIQLAADGPATMVFQRPVAFSGTVAHNVRVAARARGGDRANQRERLQQALRRFGIAALAQRSAVGLSGGELRRLALARAFALEPAVLLLDEPFDDLDALARETLSADLRRVIASTGVAVAIVTHDLQRAILLSDRMAVLDGGRLLQVGPTERVIHSPASARVARLVGMENLLPGVVRRASGPAAASVELDAQGASIPVRSSLHDGVSVWAGIRGEHLKIDVGRGAGAPIGKAVVRQMISDGLVTHVEVTWGRTVLRTHLVSGRGLARTLRAGETVTISVDPRDVCVLER